MNNGISMDGRILRSVETGGDGEVGSDTVFHFEQDDDLIHARYAGGPIRLGHLVGIHEGDHLQFRYTQINMDGETATGQSTDKIEILEDDRVRLHETWSWDSRDGTGTSILEEVREPDESSSN